MSPSHADDIVVHGSDFVLPGDHLGLFGIETILIQKHVWPPQRNAILPGALLWDHENGRQYFVPWNELAGLEVHKKPVVPE